MSEMTVEKALTLLAQGVRNRKKWREQAREDFEFVAGNQWNEQDIEAMDEAMRPRTTFNNIAPIVDAIAGHEVANRQKVSYLPRQVGSSGVNEVLTAAADYIREQSDADAEESSAFNDCCVCGEGWTDTEIDYDQDLDGRILIDRVDPLEMDVDSLSTKENHADAKWVSRSKIYGRSEAKERWPDWVFEADDNRETNEAIDVIAAAFYRSDSGEGGRPGSDSDKVLIHDFQWWEHKTVYRVPAQLIPPPLAHILLKGYAMDAKPKGDEAPFVNPKDLTPDSNGLITISSEAWSNLMKESGLPKQVFTAAVDAKAVLKQRQRCYYRMYFSGEEELERKETPTGDSFTYKAMTAKRDRKTGWYGVVRAMKDPQKWSNKFMSSMLEIIATSGKGGIMHKAGFFQDPRDAEENWANPSKDIIINDDANIETDMAPRPYNKMPPQMMTLMQYADSNIKGVAGVNPEVMGLAQTLDPSGTMEEGRRQSGLNMLSYLFDSLRRYRKEQGRVLLKMIKKYIPKGRLVRIVGPDGQQFVPLAYDDKTTEYDVIVDEAPTSPNVKQRTWDTFATLLGEIPALGSPAIMGIALDYSPFPAAMVQKIKQAQQQQAQQPPQLSPLDQAKAMDLQASAALKGAQARNLGQEGQIKAMLAQIEAQGESQKANAEVQKAQYDFMATVAKYHQAIADNQTKQAGTYFDHLKSLYGVIESANKATQSQHGTVQAAHSTVQANHATLQSAHQTVQTLNQPTEPETANG